MLHKLREAINRRLFNHTIAKVLDTPPVPAGTRDFAVLSMVHHRDIAPYLVAVKSFCRQAAPRRIVLVADPSITEEDTQLLRRHLPGVEIRPAVTFRQDGIPVGGCWERLTAIADLVADGAVVQLDADTVTLGRIDEVLAAVDSGCSFMLGTWNDQQITSLEESSEIGRKGLKTSQHIQPLVESVMQEALAGTGYRYARGCAGFSGFARGSFDRRHLLDLCARMRAHVGDRWSEWGSEQVASNLMVASHARATVLPHPRYCNADRMKDDSVFLHFIGYTRYRDRVYTRTCAALIAALSASV